MLPNAPTDGVTAAARPQPAAGSQVEGVAGTPASLSLVQPLETSVPLGALPPLKRYGTNEHDSLCPATELEQAARHAWWHADRSRIFAALQRTHQTTRRIEAFHSCGSALWLRIDTESHDLVITCNQCRDRFCQACQKNRRKRLVAAVQKRCGEATGKIRFVTLTLRHQPVPLKEQILRLIRSFHVLRRRKFWRTACEGGAWFFELKRTKDGWHPHLHALVETPWLDQAEFSKEWHAVTGDSFIVHVKPTHDDREIKYCAKYASKPLDESVVATPQHLDEAIISLKGVRMCGTFGSWKGLDLEDDDSPAAALKTIATVEEVFTNPDLAHFRAPLLERWPALKVFARPHPTLSDEEFIP